MTRAEFFSNHCLTGIHFGSQAPIRNLCLLSLWTILELVTSLANMGCDRWSLSVICWSITSMLVMQKYKRWWARVIIQWSVLLSWHMLKSLTHAGKSMVLTLNLNKSIWILVQATFEAFEATTGVLFHFLHSILVLINPTPWSRAYMSRWKSSRSLTDYVHLRI